MKQTIIDKICHLVIDWTIFALLLTPFDMYISQTQTLSLATILLIFHRARKII